MRAPKVIKEGDESHLFLEFLYICNVFTKLDDIIRPKSITQAQKRIKKPKLTFPLIGQDFPTVQPPSPYQIGALCDNICLVCA